MAVGQIIGRVSVKVIPDTKDFRRDAEKQLDKVEKTVRPAAFRARLDFTGLRRDALQAIREFNAENRAMDSRKIRFHTTIARGDMDRVIGEAIRDLNARAADRRMRIRANVVAAVTQVELDQESLKKLRRDLENWRRENDPLRIGVQLEFQNGSATYVSRRLAVLTRPRSVPIVPTLNRAATARVATALAALSGARLATSTLKNLGDLFKNLDKNIPILGSLALAVAGLAGWVASAASNLFSLSYSLAQIIPAAAVLPGIFGGMAIGLGVSIAAFRDFNTILPQVKEQFAALQDTISSNFWTEAKAPIEDFINSLLPQLVEGMGLAATQLGGFFGNLATSMQGILNPALAGMFADLASSIEIAGSGTNALVGLITTLGRVGAGYLPQLATWFVDVTTRFDNFLAQAESDGRLKGWIDTAIFNFKELGRVLGNLGGIFAGIGQAAQAAGGSTLTTLADTLQRIEDTVKGPIFQSTLIAFFQGVHTMMSNIADGAGPALTDMFVNLGTTFANIAPSIGDTIGALVEAFAELIGSRGFLSGVVAVFTGLGVAISALSPAIVAMSPAFAALGEVIGTLAATFAPILAQILVTIADVFVALTPAITGVVEVLGGAFLGAIQALTPLLIKMAPLLGKIILEAFEALAPILDDLVVQFSELVQAVIPLLPSFFNIAMAMLPLLPAFAKLALELLPPLTEALIVLTPIIREFATLLVEGLVITMPFAVAAIEAFVGIVGGAFGAVISKAVELVQEWWRRFNILSEALGRVIADIYRVTEAIKGNWLPLWVAVSDAVSGAVSRVLGFMSNLRSGAVSIFTGMWNAVNNLTNGKLGELLSAVGTRIGSLKTAFSNAWRAIVGAMPAPMQQLVRSVGSAIDNAVDEVRSFISKARGALSNGNALFSAGRTVIQGFINGIRSAFAAVRATLGALTASLPSWKGPPNTDRTILEGAGKLVMDGFLRGLESRYAAIRASLRSLTGEIGGMSVAAPGVTAGGVSRGLSGLVSGAVTEGGAAARQFIYNAAPGSSLGAEEDLFAATGRARMVGW